MEAVLTVKAEKLTQMHAKSGVNGIFVSKFRTGAPEDNAWRVVWFDKGESLNDALSKTKLLPDAAGLVCTSQGLGIRLPTTDFREKVKKIFGQERANKEASRGDRKFYEIQKCPPWVDKGDLVESLKKKWGWEVEVVRIARGWNTKTVIVGASTPPPRDAAVVDGHWLPIQPAKPAKKGEMRKLVPKKREKPQKGEGQKTSSTPAQPALEAPRVQRGGDGAEMYKMMQNFLSNINRRFDDFEETVGGRLSYIESQLEDEAEEDEDWMDDEEDDESVEKEKVPKRGKGGEGEPGDSAKRRRSRASD